MEELLASVATITPRDLEGVRRMGEPIELIDVRTPVEFLEVHAEPARLVPLGTLDPQAVMDGRRGKTSDPLYVICRSGGRAPRGVREVPGRRIHQRRQCRRRHAGVGEGGPAGRPGAKVISLERQVRIAAGSLVVLGTVLGAFVHPGFLSLAAFVGAGLVFAGITDTCGMGMLLARMPWNRAEPSSSCSSIAEV